MGDAPSEVAGLTAIVVNYNGGRDLVTLVSVLERDPAVNEIVVDNASTDGSLNALRGNLTRVNIVEAGENLGFGGRSEPRHGRIETSSLRIFLRQCNTWSRVPRRRPGRARRLHWWSAA